MVVFFTVNSGLTVVPAPKFTLMPAFEKFRITQSSTMTCRPEVKLTPLMPRVVPAPLIERLRSLTTMVPGVAVALSLTLTPLVALARIEP
jgi:hypothetical protein